MSETNYRELFAELREKRSISRYRLAKISGLGASTIQHWEVGDIEPTVKK